MDKHINIGRATESLNGDIPSKIPDQVNHPQPPEPVAIIGMALKFPQDATTQESFWNMLLEGRTAMTEVPKSRFNVDAYYHPDIKHTGTMNLRGGNYFSEDIRYFDPGFFSMSPAEAASLDPQQRFLLEVTYQALENAGIPLEKARGSHTSVHVGSFLHEQELLINRDVELDIRFKHTAFVTSFLANRLSWFYDFTGPSITLDTACSSTLHALHLACQGLRLREANMAVVAGSNIIYDPQTFVTMAHAGFLSPDSTCYTFDHRANGYSRGDGVAVVLLKLLDQAIRDGDTIRAIVRATGLNQDGRTVGGITQPNPAAQERLIRRVYQSAGLDMAKTAFFEAHGTGTPLGDVLETKALSAAFNTKERETPLIVGTIKPNVGHLEATSFLSSLIKTVLILERGLIPPNVNFQKLNPGIKADEWHLEFPLKIKPWPGKGIRRASINSFGLGGANAHAVLDDAYHYLEDHGLDGICSVQPYKQDTVLAKNTAFRTMETEDHSPHIQQRFIFVLSAADKDGIQRLMGSYSACFESLACVATQRYLCDLAYTLCERRSHLSWRSSFLAGSLEELNRKLKTTSPILFKCQRALTLVFVFTGQGAQWYAMGRELFQYQVFRSSIRAADLLLSEWECDWSLETELLRSEDSSLVNEPSLSQPLCVAIQMAICDLLQDWKVVPSLVVGHSSGEIAAAYCAGAISFRSALKIAYCRGIVCSSLENALSEPCGMLAVGSSATEVEQDLAQLSPEAQESDISIACINSPRNVTVAGSTKLIDLIRPIFDQKQLFTRRLNVRMAYHSKYMNAGVDQYKSLVANVEKGSESKANVSMISTVSGNFVRSADLQTTDYWARNLTQRVNFSSAVSYLYSTELQIQTSIPEIGNNFFLEIGPHSALKGVLRETFSDIRPSQQFSYASVLLRGKSALDTMLDTMGELHCYGFEVNLAKVNKVDGYVPRLLTNLPPYQFNHTKQYWQESRLNQMTRLREFARHDLLGSAVPDWNPLDAKWRNILRVSDNPWIAGHVVNGLDVCPAAAMLLMAVEAICQVSERRERVRGYKLREVVISRAMNAPLHTQDPGIEIEFHLRQNQEEAGKPSAWSDFVLFMLDNGNWVQCCKGSISLEFDEPTGASSVWRNDLLDNMPKLKDHTTGLESGSLYKYLESIGLQYGTSFQGVQDLQFDEGGRVLATIDIHQWRKQFPEAYLVPHVIHPAALDAFFQLMFPALSRGCHDTLPTMVPTTIDELWISQDLDSSTDAHVSAYIEAEFEGLRNSKAFGTAIHSASQRPCISGRWHMTAVSSMNKPASTKFAGKRLAYHIVTKPDPDFMNTQDVEDWCLSKQDSYTPDYHQIEEIEALCYNSMGSILRQQNCTAHSLEKLELRSYLHWAKNRLNSVGGEFSENDQLYDQDPASIDRLLQKVGQYGAEGRLTARVAKSLPQIFAGELSALEFLFSDDSVEKMYQQGLGIPYVLKYIKRYVDLLAFKNPAMYILEVGAGTGTATISAIDALMTTESGARFSRYDFTDVSPAFLERAKTTFSELGDLMNFATFDVERDPVEQDFMEHHYDLVIALNVVHATRSLSKSLQNIRRLLKQGGKFILLELTGSCTLPLEFAFALLPGWWLGTEEQRKLSPLIEEEQWHAYLKEAGFSGVETALRSHQDSRYHAYSAMISTAIDPHQSTSHFDDLTIVVSGQSNAQVRLAEDIKASSPDASHCNIVSIQNLESYDTLGGDFVFLPEIEKPLLCGISDGQLQLLQRVFSTSQRILWIANGSPFVPECHLITGLQRTYRLENEALQFSTLLLSDGIIRGSTAANIIQLLGSIQKDVPANTEAEYSEIEGLIHIARVVLNKALNDDTAFGEDKSTVRVQEFGAEPVRSLRLDIGDPGLLNTLRFCDNEATQQPLGPHEVEIALEYSGVNFRDISTVLGQLNEDVIGTEGSGFVTRAGQETGFAAGDPVTALLLGSYRTHARCDMELARKVPAGLDLAAAAALPFSFCSAYHALHNVARIQPGQSILVHSGAGGLGQAFIQLAQLVNAEIFVTVGSEEKRRLLRDLYNIDDGHIYSSRSIQYAQKIQQATRGHGVDVVVNFFRGERFRASWACLASLGHFIETGSTDVDSSLSLGSFAKGRTFASINLLNVIQNRPELAGQLLQTVLQLAAKSKIFPPKPLQIYGVSQVEEAFRHLRSGESMGKMVIKFQRQDLVSTLPSSLTRKFFKSNATYLIAGGLGGLGRKVASWMISAGAMNLVLLTRDSRDGDTATASFLKELSSDGAKIAVYKCDVSNRESLAEVMKDCAAKMPPIKGCIQAAMVLKDKQFTSMLAEDFDVALKPKVQGSWNLHMQLPEDLDFFVLFSSLVGIVPFFGQTNYAAGNAYQDALARLRLSRGQKALSLDIGMVANAGYLAEHSDLFQKLLLRGNPPVYVEDILAVLGQYLDPSTDAYKRQAQDGTFQVILGLQTPAALKAQGIDEPPWLLQRPLFRHLLQTEDDAQQPRASHDVGDAPAGGSKSIANLLTAASTFEDAVQIVSGGLVERLGRILGADTEGIDVERPLHTNGVDSLVAMDLRQWFQGAVATDIATFEILDNRSLKELAAQAAGRSTLVKDEIKRGV